MILPGINSSRVSPGHQLFFCVFILIEQFFSAFTRILSRWKLDKFDLPMLTQLPEVALSLISMSHNVSNSIEHVEAEKEQKNHIRVQLRWKSSVELYPAPGRFLTGHHYTTSNFLIKFLRGHQPEGPERDRARGFRCKIVSDSSWFTFFLTSFAFSQRTDVAVSLHSFFFRL